MITKKDKKTLEDITSLLSEDNDHCSDEDVLTHLGEIFYRILGRVNIGLDEQGSRVFTTSGACNNYIIKPNGQFVVPDSEDEDA
jgi:hypothetical protein